MGSGRSTQKGSIRITRGWAEFRTHNKIANGQTCRFKLIRGNGGGKNVLQLYFGIVLLARGIVDDIIAFNILLVDFSENQVKMALDLNFVLGLERIESLS
ncbi:hypothetical protein HAX54_052192 [Datura stramonium]|uniref:TF-B3 domain-containing protein n=1 Tax=Datura stramonium TaxID=4076 RepID=A0ABS8WT35_DATST|nr:hypothetical protein [Datura stramonium]